MPAFHANPGDMARTALASAAPAQEALNVALAQVTPNATLLVRKPTSTTT